MISISSNAFLLVVVVLAALLALLSTFTLTACGFAAGESTFTLVVTSVAVVHILAQVSLASVGPLVVTVPEPGVASVMALAADALGHGVREIHQARRGARAAEAQIVVVRQPGLAPVPEKVVAVRQPLLARVHALALHTREVHGVRAVGDALDPAAAAVRVHVGIGVDLAPVLVHVVVAVRPP